MRTHHHTPPAGYATVAVGRAWRVCRYCPDWTQTHARIAAYTLGGIARRTEHRRPALLVRTVALNTECRQRRNISRTCQQPDTFICKISYFAHIAGIGTAGRNLRKYAVTADKRCRRNSLETAALHRILQFDQGIVIVAVAVNAHHNGWSAAATEHVQSVDNPCGDAPCINRRTGNEQVTVATERHFTVGQPARHVMLAIIRAISRTTLRVVYVALK